MSNDTPLGLAAEYDKVDAIEVLAAAGATIEARNSGNNTPLMVAALEGCSGAVRKLIELGAEVNFHDSSESALLLLCGRSSKRDGRLEILQMMLKACACLDGIENLMGWTHLHKAAERSDEAIVSALIAREANIDAEMVESVLTPLIIAIENNRPAIVKLLLDAGAEGNTASKGNLTPAHSAARCPNYKRPT